MAYTQIALAAGSALATYLTASKAEKAARRRFETEQERLNQRLKDSEYQTSSQLSKLEHHTDTLRGQAGERDPFMEQAILAGTRRGTEAETTRQQQAAGLTGAARVRTAQMVAGAQAQGLLAQESARQQREQQLNQLVSSNLAQAAQISQAGYAVEQQTRTQLAAARANLTAQMEAASAQKTGALMSGMAGMAAAGMQGMATSTEAATTAKRGSIFSNYEGVPKTIRGEGYGSVLNRTMGYESPTGKFLSRAGYIKPPTSGFSLWSPSSWF